MRDIRKGEELFVDSGTLRWEESFKAMLLDAVADSFRLHRYQTVLTETIVRCACRFAWPSDEADGTGSLAQVNSFSLAKASSLVAGTAAVRPAPLIRSRPAPGRAQARP